MRHLSLLLSVVLCLSSLIGCKKNKTDLAPSIIGKWELRKQTGGIAGGETIYPSGNGTILEFSADIYTKYKNGQIIENGTYNIIKATSNQTGQLVDKLILNGQSVSQEFFIQIEETQFSFWYGGSDDIYTTYERTQ